MSKMLSSWKEIAHFFGKGVRTVQRWEKTLDLPIHRPPGAPSNVVLARTSDLEEWMHRGPVARAVGEESSGTHQADEIAPIIAKLQQEVDSLAEMAGVASLPVSDYANATERLAALAKLVSSISDKVFTNQSVKAA